MLPFVSVLVLSAFALGEPNVAKGEALFQSSVRVYGRKSFSDRLDLEEASLNLLEAEAPEADSDARMDTVMKPEKETLTGLALLYADLIWIWALLRGSASSVSMDLCASLHEFRADFLAWLTALVSFGLTRSLLLPMLSPAKKIIETHDEDDAKEVDEKVADPVSTTAVQGAMEIKLDVTNPVMIQRAREQIEEAEKRAELIKNAQPDHRDVFGCTGLHLAAHNGHTEDVIELLKRGFDVNAQDNFGDTALHMAARSNSLAIVKELLEHGADPLRSNAFGKKPCAVAVDRSVAQVLREAMKK